MFNDCRTAIFQASLTDAYAQLNLLDPNGFIETPTTLAETAEGLAITTMNNVFPMNYALLDLNNIDFDDNSEDPIGLDAFNSFEIISCPQSAFSFGWESSDDFDVKFDNLTDEFFPSESVYHYWQFGDGTGSFLNDPHHVYTEPGSYTVKLTTFTEGCGCWDTQKLIITIPDPVVAVPKECACNVNVSSDGILSETGVVVFNVDAFDDTELSSYGLEYHWFFGDGLFEVTSDPVIEHYYPYAGSYTATVWVKMSNNCFTDVIEVAVEVPNDDPTLCCDKRQNLSSQSWQFPYNGKTYKLLTNDSYTGNDIGDDKIKGCQKLYKKHGELWFGTKGTHKIHVNAVIYYKDLQTGQKCAIADNVGDFDGTESENPKVAFDFPCWQDPFGVLEENTIHILHRVWVAWPNQDSYFEKEIILGEQNCD
jgi:hypothetical protein